MGCNAPLEGHSFGAIGGKAKLEQVEADLGLSEADQGLEDIAPDTITHIELQAAQLVASAAAGFGRKGGRQRRDLG